MVLFVIRHDDINIYVVYYRDAAADGYAYYLHSCLLPSGILVELFSETKNRIKRVHNENCCYVIIPVKMKSE